MIIKDLIKNKDYDYISVRATPPEGWPEPDMFIGCCKSKDGKLISLDGDTYSDKEVVVSYEEWSDEDVENGLTIVVETEWLSGKELDREFAKIRELRKHMSLEEAIYFCEEHKCSECPVCKIKTGGNFEENCNLCCDKLKQCFNC